MVGGFWLLLEVDKEARVAASQQVAWSLLRDMPRLSRCIPKVTDVEAVERDKRYTAVVADKLGPFGLRVPIQIDIQSVEEPRRIVAELSGNDSRGQARVKGSLEAIAEPDGGGTAMRFSVRMEVLGRLAALGAAPMRRRADEIFNEFVERVRAELQESQGVS